MSAPAGASALPPAVAPAASSAAPPATHSVHSPSRGMLGGNIQHLPPNDPSNSTTVTFQTKVPTIIEPIDPPDRKIKDTGPDDSLKKEIDALFKAAYPRESMVSHQSSPIKILGRTPLVPVQANDQLLSELKPAIKTASEKCNVDPPILQNFILRYTKSYPEGQQLLHALGESGKSPKEIEQILKILLKVKPAITEARLLIQVCLKFQPRVNELADTLKMDSSELQRIVFRHATNDSEVSHCLDTLEKLDSDIAQVSSHFGIDKQHLQNGIFEMTKNRDRCSEILQMLRTLQTPLHKAASNLNVELHQLLILLLKHAGTPNEVDKVLSFLQENRSQIERTRARLEIPEHTFYDFVLFHAKTPGEVKALMRTVEAGRPGISDSPITLSKKPPFTLEKHCDNPKAEAIGTLLAKARKAGLDSSDFKKAVQQSADSLDSAFRAAFIRLQSEEFYAKNRANVDKSAFGPNLRDATKLSTGVTNFYVKEILRAGQEMLPQPPATPSEKDIKNAFGAMKTMMELTAKTADELYKRGNYDAALALLGALHQRNISRLIDPTKDLSENVSALVNTLTTNFDSQENYKVLRTQMNNDSSRPIVPFLGVYLRDFTFAYERRGDLGAKNLEQMKKHGDAQTAVATAQARFTGVPLSPPPTTLAKEALQLPDSEVMESVFTAVSDSLRVYRPKV